MSEEPVRDDTAQEHCSWAAPTVFATESMDNGWRLLMNCQLGGTSFQLVLICPAAGVALLEIEPVWTPNAIELLGERLAEAGFETRFPGYLPIIHRRLRPVDVPALEMLLADAFVWLEPITIGADTHWEEELQALLTPAAPAPSPSIALPSPAASGLHEWALVPVRARASADTPAHTLGPEHAPLRSLPAEPPATPASSPAPVALVADVGLPAPSQPIEEPLPRSNPWIGIAAVGIAATAAFLSLSPSVPVLPAPASMPSTEAEASSVPHIAAVAAEAAAPTLAPLTALPTIRAPLPAAAPPVVATIPALAATQASPPAVPLAVPVAPLARLDPLPEPPDVQGAPFWTMVTAPPQIAPLPDPVGWREPSRASAPLPVPVAESGAPLPESEPVAGAPFWTGSPGDPPRMQPVPGRAAEGDEPLQEAVRLQGPSLGTRESLLAAPPATVVPAITPPAAPTPPGLMAPALTMPPIATPAPPLAAPRPAPAPLRERPAMVPAAVIPTAPAMSASDIEAARRRGEALAAIGDISGARRFLERAARGGSAAAALAMAESFDPHILAERGVVGLRPDRAAALAWYHRALALGAAGSASRIANLEAER